MVAFSAVRRPRAYPVSFAISSSKNAWTFWQVNDRLPGEYSVLGVGRCVRVEAPGWMGIEVLFAELLSQP